MNFDLRYFFDYGSNNQIIADALKNESEDAIDRVLEILQNRIDQFGVSEPLFKNRATENHSRIGWSPRF